jgi:hypothetical protein
MHSIYLHISIISGPEVEVDMWCEWGEVMRRGRILIMVKSGGRGRGGGWTPSTNNEIFARVARATSVFHTLGSTRNEREQRPIQ